MTVFDVLSFIGGIALFLFGVCFYFYFIFK